MQTLSTTTYMAIPSVPPSMPPPPLTLCLAATCPPPPTWQSRQCPPPAPPPLPPCRYFNENILGPIQSDLLKFTWLTERYTCDGLPERTPFFFEYPCLLSMMLKEMKYGINFGLVEWRLAPIAGSPGSAGIPAIAPASPFRWAMGTTDVSHSQSRVAMRHPGAGARRITVAGLTPSSVFVATTGCGAAATHKGWTTAEGVAAWNATEVKCGLTVTTEPAPALKSDDDAVCEITVHPDQVSHEISKLTMGCHSDTGCKETRTVQPVASFPEILRAFSSFVYERFKFVHERFRAFVLKFAALVRRASGSRARLRNRVRVSVRGSDGCAVRPGPARGLPLQMDRPQCRVQHVWRR